MEGKIAVQLLNVSQHGHIFWNKWRPNYGPWAARQLILSGLWQVSENAFLAAHHSLFSHKLAHSLTCFANRPSTFIRHWILSWTQVLGKFTFYQFNLVQCSVHTFENEHVWFIVYKSTFWTQVHGFQKLTNLFFSPLLCCEQLFVQIIDRAHVQPQTAIFL